MKKFWQSNVFYFFTLYALKACNALKYIDLAIIKVLYSFYSKKAIPNIEIRNGFFTYLSIFILHGPTSLDPIL